MSERAGRVDYAALSARRLDLRNVGSEKSTGDKNSHVANIALEDDNIPLTYEEAMQRSDADDWYVAIDKEMTSMLTNKVFDLVPRPATNVVGSRWVFTRKIMPDGTKQAKARLVAQGSAKRRAWIIQPPLQL